MAETAFPRGDEGKTNLYFFREGRNPSGTRFIALLKNADRPTYTGVWSTSADGKDVRFFDLAPSHHAWLDDDTILEGRHFTAYKDDGSGMPHRVAEVGVSMSTRSSCPAASGSSSTPTRSRPTRTSSSSTDPAGSSCRWPG
jgi:hypothetical protein